MILLGKGLSFRLPLYRTTMGNVGHVSRIGSMSAPDLRKIRSFRRRGEMDTMYRHL